jgi:tetratricopeptide (TPR) repeat protein
LEEKWRPKIKGDTLRLLIIICGLIQFLLLISWKCFSSDTLPLKSVDKFGQSKTSLKNHYPVLIEKYDKQAEYGKKHRSMKEYAEILYPEKEKQAEYLKNEADKLREQGEIGEAIMIYRKIAEEYRNTERGGESSFIIANIIEQQEDEQDAVKGTIEEYEKLIRDYPKTKYSEEVHFKLVRKYQKLGKINEGIRILENFIKNYPESKKKEQALFLLGLLYRETKNSENMKKVWNEYLKNYPEGTYTSIINSFLKGGEEK